MSYSDQALIFAKIPVNHQIREEDRISFLYLEYCRIEQNRTGVVALREYEDDIRAKLIQIPVAGIAVMFLGPGTSITQPAIASCTRAGLTIVFTGENGIPYYSHATALTSSARWAIAQARLVSNEKHAREAARKLYKNQLSIDINADLTISQMRGIEGQMVRKLYRDMSRKYGITNFRRNTKSGDQVNAALNMLGGIIYGCAASACAALSVNPALGIIHRGDAKALLFDLADQYKPKSVIPLAFRALDQSDPMTWSRRELRRHLHRDLILTKMISLLMELFQPFLPKINDDRLINDRGEVKGHLSWGDDA